MVHVGFGLAIVIFYRFEVGLGSNFNGSFSARVQIALKKNNSVKLVLDRFIFACLRCSNGLRCIFFFPALCLLTNFATL